MFGRSLSKVAQRRFKCSASLFGQRAIDYQRNFKSSEEHFNARVTVRQKGGGIGKAVRLGSNLYRHHRLLPRSLLKEFKYSMALAVPLAKNHLRSTHSRYHAGYRHSRSPHILRGTGGSI